VYLAPHTGRFTLKVSRNLFGVNINIAATRFPTKAGLTIYVNSNNNSRNISLIEHRDFYEAILIYAHKTSKQSFTSRKELVEIEKVYSQAHLHDGWMVNL